MSYFLVTLRHPHIDCGHIPKLSSMAKLRLFLPSLSTMQALDGEPGSDCGGLVTQLLQPHGLYSARLLCPWDSPGKNTGVGLPFPTSGDLPNPGIKPRSPALQADSLPTESPRKPQFPTLCLPIAFPAFSVKRSEKHVLKKPPCRTCSGPVATWPD